MTAVFYNGQVIGNVKIYIDGSPQTLTQRQGTTGNRSVSASARIGGQRNIGDAPYDANGYRFNGVLDEVAIYNGELNPTTISQHHAAR